MQCELCTVPQGRHHPVHKRTKCSRGSFCSLLPEAPQLAPHFQLGVLGPELGGLFDARTSHTLPLPVGALDSPKLNGRRLTHPDCR